MKIPQSFLRQAVDLADLGRKADENFEAIERELATHEKAVGAFRVTRSATVNPASGAVVLFDDEAAAGEEYDYSGWYDPTTGKYQPLIAGVYSFIGSTAAANNPTVAGQFWQTELHKNGVIFAMDWRYAGTGALFFEPVKVLGEIFLNGTTDYVQVVRSTNYANTTIGAVASRTFFCGHRVGGKP